MDDSWKEQFPKNNRYFETTNGILYHGDCLEIMKKFPKECIDLVLTDPPYGINLKSQRETSKFHNVKIENDENPIVIENAIPEISRITNTIYMFIGWSTIGKIQQTFERYFVYKNCLVWDKMWFGMGNNWRPNHEFIMYGVKGWSGKIDANNKENILRHRRISPLKLSHMCEKPISLLIEMIEQHNGLVLDCFLGTGATAIACEKLNRKWIGIEISEDYCKIAKERVKRIVKQKVFNLELQ